MNKTGVCCSAVVTILKKKHKQAKEDTKSGHNNDVKFERDSIQRKTGKAKVTYSGKGERVNHNVQSRS